MVLSLAFVVLILVIAFRQSTLGLFSALIMAVLTICCAAAAIGMHEWMAINLLAPYWKPNFSYPIALAAAFGVPLILLRLLFDRTITRACLMPVWLDRAGGALCGLVTGMTMVGVLALAIQMVPFGRTILGYSAVTSYAQDAGSLPPPAPADRDIRPIRPGLQSGTDSANQSARDSGGLWLGPDRFAVFVAWLLSGGLFSGESNFYRDNPDFAGWIGRVNAVPSEVSRFTQPDSISVTGVSRVDFIYKLTPGDSSRNQQPAYDPIEPPAGTVFRVVRVNFAEGAKDELHSVLFTLRQFRLLGQQPGSGRILQLYPIAIQQEDASQPVNRHVCSLQGPGGERPLIDDVLKPRKDNEPVEVVFAVPNDLEPWFIEYKRGARANLSFKDSPPPAESAAAPSPPPEEQAAASPPPRQGPRTRRVSARPTNSLFSDNLPMPLRAYQRRANVSLERNALANGHLVGRVSEQESGSDPEISKFAVPADKRLLHLNMNFLQARSALGRAISSAVGVVQNYYVTDSNGNRHTLAGKYAIASANGVEYVEVQYFPDQAGLAGSNQPFAEIKEQNLTGEYTLVLLFLVDPGARLVSFSSGSSATAGDDLTSQNLVAPE